MLVEQRFAQEAERRLHEALRLRPNMLPALERLLELYALQMRRDDIRAVLESIRRQRPWSLEELVLYVSAAQRVVETDEGIRQMRHCLAAVPDDFRSRLLLGRYLLDAEEYAEAERTLEAALVDRASSSRAALWLTTAIRSPSPTPSASSPACQARTRLMSSP